jgi:hypothetical protein
MAVTFAQANEIVRAAEEADWTVVGTYQIEADGWEDDTHYLVVRGTAGRPESGHHPRPSAAGEQGDWRD